MYIIFGFFFSLSICCCCHFLISSRFCTSHCSFFRSKVNSDLFWKAILPARLNAFIFMPSIKSLFETRFAWIHSNGKQRIFSPHNFCSTCIGERGALVANNFDNKPLMEHTLSNAPNAWHFWVNELGRMDLPPCTRLVMYFFSIAYHLSYCANYFISHFNTVCSLIFFPSNNSIALNLCEKKWNDERKKTHRMAMLVTMMMTAAQHFS